MESVVNNLSYAIITFNNCVEQALGYNNCDILGGSSGLVSLALNFECRLTEAVNNYGVDALNQCCFSLSPFSNSNIKASISEEMYSCNYLNLNAVNENDINKIQSGLIWSAINIGFFVLVFKWYAAPVLMNILAPAASEK